MGFIPSKKLIINNKTWFKKPCVPTHDKEEISKICKDLKTELDKHPKGVGLAANQIGYNKRIALLRPMPGQDIYLINPILLNKSTVKVKSVEGCLSFPGKQTTIKRHESIMICISEDSTPEEMSGFLSNIAQHELDHLNGKLCFDQDGRNASKFTPTKKKRRKR